MDYKRPDYGEVLHRRMECLRALRANPQRLPAIKLHYKLNPIDFIADWGVTSDPRNLEVGLPVLIPFVPWQRQEEWLYWLLDRWRSREPGITEKSRDMGCSVTFMSLMATLALFNDRFAAGVGSRKEDLVDKVGSPDSLFFKARMFLEHLPREFRGGWSPRDKSRNAHMKIEIPETNSTIVGEAGDNIGRGGRTSIYGVDESAFLARPMLVEASLSATTNCRIDLSSVNGMDNPFAQKRHGGKVKVFTFHWRQDPRKDEVWYERQCEQLDPLIVAQEIDLDYSGSKPGILIPSKWVQAAIDAHIKLGVQPTGAREAALDVADEGKDLNAFSARHGVVMEHLESWSGKDGDINATTHRAFMICDTKTLESFRYDGDGLGAGVRGDARVINEQRADNDVRQIRVDEFRGSGEVMDPESFVVEGDDKRAGRRNKDFFKNYKAQSWWALRKRFYTTYKAVVDKKPFDPDDIISIPSTLPEQAKLMVELSQPLYKIDNTGKIVVDKAPDGARSPNLADSVMILYAPYKRIHGLLDHFLE